jgi:ABC-type phosphate transport system substrate-binding protein
MRLNPLLALLAFAGSPVAPVAIPAQEFTVIVNAANPVTTLPKDEVARMFLKKTVTWESGEPIAAVELPSSTKAREAFARTVLNKSLAQVKSYWQQQIFSGRDVPPPEKQSDGDVLAFVRANANAIGYVAKGKDVGRGVKVLEIGP